MAGPLFPNQRGAQRHAVQLLNVEEKEKLQSVHRQLVHKGKGKKPQVTYQYAAALPSNLTARLQYYQSLE